MRSFVILLLAVVGLATMSPIAIASPDLEGPGTGPKLKPPSESVVYDRLTAWLLAEKASEAVQAEVDAQWKKEPPAATLLDRLAGCFALADPRARALVEICSAPRRGVSLPELGWLREPGVAEFEACNLRLLYGRWLAHERLYDELLDQVRGLSPTEVVDPATLLFCQSVGFYRLLDKEAGLRAVDRLLGDVADVPGRYRALAMLMRGDLAELDEKNLDHIARRMDDIRRRLDLGRAGKQVVEIENGVIKSLDKLIEDMEKQQQQGGGSAGSFGPSSPMKDSRIAPLKGPGQVDHKQVGSTAGWGDLPAKQREEALQQIGKDFPAHYRDVIEQYFRKLASEGER